MDKVWFCNYFLFVGLLIMMFLSPSFDLIF